MADHHQHNPRHRIHNNTRTIRRLLDLIDQRAARADASTLAPPPTGGGDRVQTSGYADPTGNTVRDRDQLLGQVERGLWEAARWADFGADLLRAYAPDRKPDDRCTCPEQCCPNGCHRHRTDDGTEHPTCRQKRARARRRGEPWATADCHSVTEAQTGE